MELIQTISTQAAERFLAFKRTAGFGHPVKGSSSLYQTYHLVRLSLEVQTAAS